MKSQKDLNKKYMKNNKIIQLYGKDEEQLGLVSAPLEMTDKEIEKTISDAFEACKDGNMEEEIFIILESKGLTRIFIDIEIYL